MQHEWCRYLKLLNTNQFVAAIRENVGQSETRQATAQLVAMCHGLSREAGWHDKPREVGTMLMLIVSELAEGMEGDRKNLMDDKLPHRPMLEVELADALIRICDLAGAKGYDLGGAVAEKLLFNTQRADHKREARESAGGKAY